MNLEQINKVNWLSAQKTIPLFIQHKIGHHFSGVNDPPPQCYALKQVRGARVIEAPKTPPTFAEEETCQILGEADGLMTRSKNITIAVKSADCVPVLMADQNQSFGFAIHAGWRGLFLGILEEALRLYKNLYPTFDNLLVAIGPSIGLEHFEIGPDVLELFFESRSLNLTHEEQMFCLSKGVLDRWHLDLQASAVLFLLKTGLPAQNISVVRSCTYDRADLWHSYRREGEKCGTNWSALTLK